MCNFLVSKPGHQQSNINFVFFFFFFLSLHLSCIHQSLATSCLLALLALLTALSRRDRPITCVDSDGMDAGYLEAACWAEGSFGEVPRADHPDGGVGVPGVAGRVRAPLDGSSRFRPGSGRAAPTVMDHRRYLWVPAALLAAAATFCLPR